MCRTEQSLCKDRPKTFTNQLKPVLFNERIFFINLYQAGLTGQKTSAGY